MFPWLVVAVQPFFCRHEVYVFAALQYTFNVVVAIQFAFRSAGAGGNKALKSILGFQRQNTPARTEGLGKIFLLAGYSPQVCQ